jgi:ABC-type polysaccharide/polyol phosphate transport system ATPase subunit
MKSDLAVRAEGLGKCYRLYDSGSGRVIEKLTRGRVKRHTEKWALRDVSFELPRGAALGVVGGNGAGKSTLLKILTGTTRPTTGRFEIHGRLGSLLELGAGFHPAFSGKDNIYMNAAMLGIPRAEVKRRYEELADFAELGDYLMQPVRTYSSGMSMRLGFTVAMMSNPDVLILDEILAVGDQHFQKKCMDRIREIREAGTTILFVSHSVYHVRQMCDEAIWIHQGQVVMRGNPVSVTDEYVNFQYALSGGQSAIAEKHGGEGAFKDLPHLSEVRLTRAGEEDPAAEFRYGDEMEVHIGWRDPKKTGPHHVGFIVYRNDDIMLFGASSKDGLPPLSGAGGSVVARLPVSMLAGEYYVSGFLVEENCEHVVDQRLSWARFKVTYEGIEKGIYQPAVKWTADNGTAPR